MPVSTRRTSPSTHRTRGSGSPWGDGVNATATAQDTEDGALPSDAIRWRVRLRHGSHFHPYAGPSTGSSIDVVYPAPEDLRATTNSFLVVTAAVTDSRGLRSVTSQQLLPRKVRLTFETDPAGGRVLVDESSTRTPDDVVSWSGYILRAEAPGQSFGGGRTPSKPGRTAAPGATAS